MFRHVFLFRAYIILDKRGSKKMARKRFRSKKKKKTLFKLRYLVYLGIIYFTYQVTTGILMNHQLATSNEQFLLAMMNDSNHHILYEKNNKNIVHQLTKLLTNIDMNQPVAMLENTFHYKTSDKTESKQEVAKLVSQEVDDSKQKTQETNFIHDPKPNEISKDPRVYIYNTHQLENYSMKNLEAYNITPNVMMATYLLREKLNKAGISTIAEESNLNDFMKENKWTVKDPYKASRQFLNQTLEKNKNLELLIDIHRDAIPKTSSTISINGKDYAKVLFVIGMNNQNYQVNTTLSQKLSDMINQKYPKLSRGVLPKKGAGVNGVYNQDISGKIILIECGGYENTIDEVSNTIEVLSEVIKEYLGEKHEA